MMNSLGDFLIGCLSLLDATVDDDCANDCVGVVSDSFESLVDWRESGFLWKESLIEVLSRFDIFVIDTYRYEPVVDVL